jgi:glycosyltransferase involved in cell wall biosynthesis
MQISIAFNENGFGGPASFVRKFREGLERRGVGVSLGTSGAADVLLVIAQWKLGEVREARRRGARVVQRQNGAYYFGGAGLRYPALNYRMRHIRQRMADYIIYQSEYSRQQAGRFLGSEPRRLLGSTLVYNGVDLQWYHPAPRAAGRGTVRLLTALNLYRSAQELVPSLDAVARLRAGGTDAEIVVVGQVSPELAATVRAQGLDGPWVRWTPRLGRDEMREAMREADVFLYAKHNTNCPNVVIEALACGLPVVGFASGAMPEIVGSEAGALAPHPHNGYLRIRPGDPALFADAIREVLDDYATRRQGARARAEAMFSIDTMTDAYLRAFRTVLAGSQ